MKKFTMIAFILFTYSSLLHAVNERGIYINQSTLENSQKLNRLISESKNTGINTFVVDLDKITKNYQKNINLIKNNGIKYVARIVIFPNGGDVQHVRSKTFWETRYQLVDAAIRFGAQEIQLDYIRYNTKRRPSPENSQDILEVIKWFKQKIAKHNIPLQIDIFGEVSFKPSKRIGQNIALFANSVDVVCPMVYPSHYNPPRYHSDRPYQTIDKSIKAMKQQLNHSMPFKLRPFIEASNYRYSMNFEKRVKYIAAQIKAVEDNKADGWYVWSANNHYDALFKALRNKDSLFQALQNKDAVFTQKNVDITPNSPKAHLR